ncbi:MAG: transposase, partial [Oligoflexia bacterium]|nr:transposase [Oligoflexia bacterium]
MRLVYKLGLRQTEGFLESISKLMKIDIKIPD